MTLPPVITLGSEQKFAELRALASILKLTKVQLIDKFWPLGNGISNESIEISVGQELRRVHHEQIIHMFENVIGKENIPNIYVTYDWAIKVIIAFNEGYSFFEATQIKITPQTNLEPNWFNITPIPNEPELHWVAVGKKKE